VLFRSYFTLSRFPSASQIVQRADQSAWFLEGSISGTFALGTATDGSFVAPNATTLTLANRTGLNGLINAEITCSTTNASSGTTCSAGNEEFGIAFIAPQAGVPYEVCFDFMVAPFGAGAGDDLEMNLRMVKTTNASQTAVETSPYTNQIYQATTTSIARAGDNGRHCVVSQASDTTSKETFRMQKQITVYIGTPAPSFGSTTLRYSVRPLSSAQAKAFVAGSAFYGRTGIAKRGIATLNCDAGSAITTNPDTMISSIGNISGGACAVVLATSYFSSQPECTASVFTAQGATTSTVYSASATPSSSTAVSIDCGLASGAVCTAVDITLDCTGSL
jgi:hypothetical protein